MRKPDNPYSAIKTIFHEPNRLAIMSTLSNTSDGMSFNELKSECELTDGNLSRHLKVLEEARAVKIKKSFVHSKPLTTVQITDRGREHFLEYLQALEEVLKLAAEAAAPQDQQPAFLLPVLKPARN